MRSEIATWGVLIFYLAVIAAAVQVWCWAWERRRWRTQRYRTVFWRSWDTEWRDWRVQAVRRPKPKGGAVGVRVGPLCLGVLWRRR